MSRIPRSARGLIAATAVTAAVVALAGCAPAADDSSRLVIALDSDQAALGYDPLRYGNGQRMFFEGLYDSLFVLDETGAVVPDLVTDFSYNDDNTELTLDLDTSVTFDDGTALSADLVKQNLDARDTKELSAYNGFAADGATPISDVTVVDDDTVTLTFPAASEGFESNLVFPAGVIVGPTGAADRSSLDTAPDGSGPLQLDADATVKGNTYLLTKKDGRDDAADYPFDSYEIRPILDPQARVNAVVSGDADIAYVTASTKDQVTSAGKELLVNGGTVYNLLPFDKNGSVVPAFASADVFRALSMSIDRETLINAIHPGERPTASVLPLDNPGYDADLETAFAYDPDAAKELLATAGYPDGFDLTVTVSSDSQRDWEAIQPYFEAIGVNVTLQNASSTEEFFAAVQTTGIGGPIPLTWSNPAGNVFGVLFGFANYHNAENGAIQGAMGAVLGAQDDASRAAALVGLNDAIAQSGWLIPLYEQEANWGYDSAKVSGATFPGADAFPTLSTITPAS